MTKVVSFGHGDGVTWCEHGVLVVAILLHENTAQTIHRNRRPMTADFPYVRIAWFRIDTTGTGGFHDTLSKLENISL
jgi:hypothetical protein